MQGIAIHKRPRATYDNDTISHMLGRLHYEHNNQGQHRENINKAQDELNTTNEYMDAFKGWQGRHDNHYGDLQNMLEKDEQALARSKVAGRKHYGKFENAVVRFANAMQQAKKKGGHIKYKLKKRKNKKK